LSIKPKYIVQLDRTVALLSVWKCWRVGPSPFWPRRYVMVSDFETRQF